jgi:hypothetical protein
VPVAVALAEMLFTPQTFGVEAYIYLSIFFGLIFGFIIALKKLVFIRRSIIYFSINLSLMFYIVFSYFYGFWSLSPIILGIVLFAGAFFLFRDLYINAFRFSKHSAEFAAGVFSFIIVELLWIISISALIFPLKSSVAIFCLFVCNYLYVSHLKRSGRSMSHELSEFADIMRI